MRTIRIHTMMMTTTTFRPHTRLSGGRFRSSFRYYSRAQATVDDGFKNGMPPSNCNINFTRYSFVVCFIARKKAEKRIR